MTTTPETLTDDQIRAMARAAYYAGDLPLQTLCAIALYDPSETYYYVQPGRHATTAQARAEIARLIAETER